jgi:predicted methyltransferase
MNLLAASRRCLLATLGGCASPAALSPERIGAIVASLERSAADRVNGVRRKPAEMLAFIGPMFNHPKDQFVLKFVKPR